MGLAGGRRRHDRPGVAARCARSTPSEKITNSFAVDETGGVFIVSDAALYRFDAGAGRRAGGRPGGRSTRTPACTSPARCSPGSGTTPTLMGSQYVAITDNADPMNVVVYQRAPHRDAARAWCASQPVFEQGASATDNSLIGTGRSLIVENNYGYSGPDRDHAGRHHDARARARRHHRAAATAAARSGAATRSRPRWCRSCRSRPGSSTPTRSRRPDGNDAWYFTAIDFRTGATVYKRLAGTGLGLQQPLRAGHARPRRHRLRGRARRARAAARPVVARGRSAPNRRRMKRPPFAHRAGSHIGNAGHIGVRVVERAGGGQRRLDQPGPATAADQRVEPSRPARAGT